MADGNPILAGGSKKSIGVDILVVDPQPESRSLLKSALRSVSRVHSIRETSNPQNAINMLGENPAHIVIVEHDLGDFNVFDLVKQIRSSPSGTNTNFVLMSSSFDMESRKDGIEAGILGYLAKPFDVLGLETAIRDSLGKVSTNHKDTLNKVRRISFFSDFTDLELVRLLKICHTRKFTKDEYLFREGEKGDRLFILLSGIVNIEKHRAEGPERLAELHPGNCFGEMALVDDEPRSADARAGSDCMVMEVNAQIINNINDILALKVFRKLAIVVTKKLRAYTN